MAQTSYKINLFNAFPGMLADMTEAEVESAVNADVVSLPAGIMLALTGSPIVSGEVVLPTAVPATAVPAGIAVHTQAANTIGLQTQSATDNIFVVGAPIGILRKGRVYVNTEEAVQKGDPAYYRYTINTGFPQLGAFANVTDSGKNQLVYGARFELAGDSPPTNPGNMAVLSFDMNAFLAGLTHS